jgi:hypothetical protein
MSSRTCSFGCAEVSRLRTSTFGPMATQGTSPAVAGCSSDPMAWRPTTTFCCPQMGRRSSFLAGEYQLELFVSMVGKAPPHRLVDVRLSVSESISKALRGREQGLYFDWGPDSSRYHAHVRESKAPTAKLLRELLQRGAV